jgi:hypothetical protein
MFDLEKSIADWRRQTKSGRSKAEAFKSAVQTIGPAHAVQSEFEKVEETEEEREWKEGQIWSGAILGLLQLILIGAVLFNSDMTFGQRMSGLAAIATPILLVAVGRLSCRIFPVTRSLRTKTATIVILGNVPGIIWVGIFTRFFLMGREFPFGQYLATLLWANCPPLGVFLGLLWGIQTAARKKVAMAGS